MPPPPTLATSTTAEAETVAIEAAPSILGHIKNFLHTHFPTLPFSVRKALHDKTLLRAYLLFVGIQFCDVVTSILCRQTGGVEVSAFPNALAERMGLSGFLWSKIPVLIFILLAISKMPRRISIAILWLATFGMVFVVMDNLHLFWTYSNSPLLHFFGWFHF